MKIKTKKLAFIFLLIILALGSFLRFFRLETFTNWLSDDSARDVLVSKHLFLDGSRKVAPYAAHGLGILNNSPLYFYVLAILWSVSHSAIFMVAVFAVLGVITIYLAFVFGKELINEKFGLILAFLFSVSFVLVKFSRSVYQAHLMPFWVLVFLVTLVKSIKKKSIGWLLISEFTLFLGLHFHYSSLLLMPFGLVWLIFSLARVKSKKNIYKIFLTSFVAGLMILGWVEATYQFKPFDQVTFLNMNFKSGLNNFGNNLIESNQIIFRALFGGVEKWGVVMAGLLIGGVLVLGLFDLFKKTLKLETVFIVSLFSSLFLTGFFNTNWKTEWVFATIYPVVIILSGYLIYRLFGSKTKNIVAGGLLIIIVGSLAVNNLMFFRFHSNEKAISLEIAKTILKDYSNKDFNFMVWHRADSTIVPWDWFSSGIWYQLENLSQVSLIKTVPIKESLTNIKPLVVNPKVEYLICSDFNQGISLESCKKQFLKNRTKINSVKIGESYSSDFNYIIYRLNL